MPPRLLNDDPDLPAACLGCDILLLAQEASNTVKLRAICPGCGEVFGRHSTAWLPADEDTTLLFDQALERLKVQEYTFDAASVLLKTYFDRFTDPGYCDQNHVTVQDMDSFHHDGPWGVALRAHYTFSLNRPPDYGSFVEWRCRVNLHGKWPTVRGAA